MAKSEGNGYSERQVLIIDDNRDFVRATKASLIEELGCKVISADCGVYGLDAHRERKPEIILIDWIMPDMNGLNVIKRIREGNLDQRPPYILIVTGHYDNRRAMDAMLAGADEVLEKPIRGKELLKQAREYLGKCNGKR